MAAYCIQNSAVLSFRQYNESCLKEDTRNLPLQQLSEQHNVTLINITTNTTLAEPSHASVDSGNRTCGQSKDFSKPLPVIETDEDMRCEQNICGISMKQQVAHATATDLPTSLILFRVIMMSSVLLNFVFVLIYRNTIFGRCVRSKNRSNSNRVATIDNEVL